MGKQLCGSGKTSKHWYMQCSQPRTLHKEDMTLHRSQRPKWSTVARTLLFIDELIAKFYDTVFFTIVNMDKVVNDTASRIPKIYLHGLTYWKIPMKWLLMETVVASDIPKKTRLHIHQTIRCYRHCWWHGGIWEIRTGTWQQSNPVPWNNQKEQTVTKQRKVTVQTDKCHSLDISGAQKEFCQIQKRSNPSWRWTFHKTRKLCTAFLVL